MKSFINTERGLEKVVNFTTMGFTTRPATFLEKVRYCLYHRVWPSPLKFDLEVVGEVQPRTEE